MPRLDWDRLRRNVPLDGADPRVDPDGAVLWEREIGAARASDPNASPPSHESRVGVQRLRAGIVIRRVREEQRKVDDAPSKPSATMPPERSPAELDPSAWIACPRCHAWVPRKKLLLHARASCTRKG